MEGQVKWEGRSNTPGVIMAHALLDNVGCGVIGNFQTDQHHLMLKELHMRPYI